MTQPRTNYKTFPLVSHGDISGAVHAAYWCADHKMIWDQTGRQADFITHLKDEHGYVQQ